MKLPSRLFGPAQITGTFAAPQVIYTAPASSIVIVKMVAISGSGFVLGIGTPGEGTAVLGDYTTGTGVGPDTYEMYLVLAAGEELWCLSFSGTLPTVTVCGDVETVGE